MTAADRATRTARWSLLLFVLCAAPISLSGGFAGAAATGLREGFEAALALDAELRGIAADRTVADARRARADSLLPGAPTVGLGYRTDQVLRNRGLREYEGEIDAPIWLPGESRALRNAAEAQLAELEARAARRRLLVAGLVRDAWWDWALTGAAREALVQRVTLARSLERDIVRQVRGGNLPETDRLVATADLRDAEAAERAAALELRGAALAFRTLTGSLPTAAPPETLRVGAPGTHTDPRLAASEALVEAGRAAERLVRIRDRASPEIGLQFRHERDAFNEPWGSRLLLRMSLPLQNPPARREQLADARATVAAGLAGLSTAERTLAGERDRADRAREAAGALLVIAEARYTALRNQLGLVEQAFRAGQQPLIEVVRVRAQLAEADGTLRRARVEEGRSISIVNQAAGMLP